jgi:hypothetical protein
VYWNSVGPRTGARPLRLAHEGPRRAQALGQEVRQVAAPAAGIVAQPLLGHERDCGGDRGLRGARQALVGLVQRACRPEQHVVGDRREWLVRRARQRARAVLAEERRAVVDEPGAPVPDEQVRVARRAVDVGRERVEPDDVGRQLGIDIGHRGGCEGERPGQEVDAEVDAGARAQQVLDLGIGLGARELGGQRDRHELGDRQPQPPRQLAHDDLGHERRRPLPRAAVLRDVQPVVVGLHQAGQRPALPQGLDVAGSGHRPQLRLHAP